MTRDGCFLKCSFKFEAWAYQLQHNLNWRSRESFNIPYLSSAFIWDMIPFIQEVLASLAKLQPVYPASHSSLPLVMSLTHHPFHTNLSHFYWYFPLLKHLFKDFIISLQVSHFEHYLVIVTSPFLNWVNISVVAFINWLWFQCRFVEF